MFSQKDINDDSLKYMVEVKECQVLRMKEVLTILERLSLRWVTIGDYVVVMNSKVDATIGGEPYLALQLWFNMISGKMICRIWDHTVAIEKVNNNQEFREACISHFKGRPCIGNLTNVEVNEQSWKNFVISHTPMPRKISRSCRKVLDPGTDISIKCCPECLNLGKLQSDDMETSNITEKLFNEGGQREEMEEITGDTMPSGTDKKSIPFKITGEDNFERFEMKLHSQHGEQEIMTLEEDDASEVVMESQSVPTTSDKALNVQAIRLSHERYKRYVKKECEICEKTIGIACFASHMSKQHGMTGTIYKQCEICGKKVSTHNFRRHAIRNHFLGRFLCDKCSFVGSFAKEVFEHTKEEHGKHNSAKCPSCKKEQPLDDLENHYISCISKKLKSEQGDFVCETCGKRLKSRVAYSVHIKIHLREQADNDDLYHFCDKCDKKFTESLSLKHHVRSEHENVEYKCSSCPMTFKTYFMLTCHQNIVHSTDEKYQCKFCGKRLGNTDHLKRHELIHEDPKFQCKFCPKKLKTLIALKAHEGHHTGELPFKCPVCEAGFVSASSLRQHKRGVHKIAGPRGGKTGWWKSKPKQ